MAKQLALLFASYIIVAFGQPAWSETLSIVVAIGGYAIFWLALLDFRTAKQRFLIGSAWGTAVQVVHLSWMSAHDLVGPGILFGYVCLSIMVGVQFGLLCLLIRRPVLREVFPLMAIAGCWTLMEWARVYILSGFLWNPVGLSLSASIYPMQLAAIAGVYGLSFWVMLTNLLGLRWWMCNRSLPAFALWAIVAVTPYLFGVAHLHWHMARSSDEKPLEALLVQTAQDPTACLHLGDQDLVQYAYNQWCHMLHYLKTSHDGSVDLIALPESSVPFSAYQSVYPLESVREAFRQILGEDSLAHLPHSDRSLVRIYGEGEEAFPVVSNAYWAQALSNFFRADVIAGLQDVDSGDQGEVHFYQAALHFRPEDSYRPRYEKRVLVPIGEYIFDDPFGWCQSIAALHGLHGSFTAGKQAQVFDGARAPVAGVSICYEEIFGHLMRENRLKGAEVLVNITNDGWYPKSRLPQQHFDHARLRSVENGVPMLRACTTGVTAGVDSLGRIVGVLGDHPITRQEEAGALKISLPTYTYQTLYTQVGDGLIVGLSFILAFLGFRYRYFKYAWPGHR